MPLNNPSIPQKKETSLTLLTDLANKYGSDKGTETFPNHGYTEYYYHAFKKLRYEPIKILEIGILNGASLKMWHEFFPEAIIIGIDNKNIPNFQEFRIRTFKGDQGNKQDLIKLIATYGGNYNIIIDDGCHKSTYQKISFEFLKHHLVRNGFYFIEDLDCRLSIDMKKEIIRSPLWSLQYNDKLGVYVKK